MLPCSGDQMSERHTNVCQVRITRTSKFINDFEHRIKGVSDFIIVENTVLLYLCHTEESAFHQIVLNIIERAFIKLIDPSPTYEAKIGHNSTLFTALISSTSISSSLALNLL